MKVKQVVFDQYKMSENQLRSIKGGIATCNDDGEASDHMYSDGTTEFWKDRSTECDAHCEE